MKFIIFLIMISVGATCFAEDIYVPKFNEREPWTPYIVNLLLEALKRTSNGTKDHFIWVTTDMTQDRALTVLRENKDLDIYWTMTSIKREMNLNVVRIPLMKGLLGSRILIINKDSEKKFSKISSFDDFKKNIKVGQGHDWPDSAIQIASGIQVETSPVYDSLYKMLKVKRFDGIPLGVNEVSEELSKHNDPQFMIEKRIALVYPAPVFFFVSPAKISLAKRIEDGLKSMIKDGTFEKQFKLKWSKYLLSKNMKNRIIFNLPNPYLSKETAKMIQDHPEYFLFKPVL